MIGVVSLSWPVSDCALCLWHNVFYIYAWLIYLSMIMIVIIIIQDHVKLTRLVLFDLFFFFPRLFICLSIYLSICQDALLMYGPNISKFNSLSTPHK